MQDYYQYQQNTTTRSNKNSAALLQHGPLRRSCGCLSLRVGVHESNRTRGQPLHKHHILHKHRWGTWLNAAMEAQREKGRAGEKVSSPVVAPSNQIPFKGTETPSNLPRTKQTHLFRLFFPSFFKIQEALETNMYSVPSSVLSGQMRVTLKHFIFLITAKHNHMQLFHTMEVT